MILYNKKYLIEIILASWTLTMNDNATTSKFLKLKKKFVKLVTKVLKQNGILTSTKELILRRCHTNVIFATRDLC